MAYTALYRKLRPETFTQIVGQDHIVKILTNQIKSGRINHAYLFCGTRGTGKTSTAKVFAKALNCEEPDGVNPCNKCKSCVATNLNNSLNIVEIDAASNNGVDNIRDIKEEVKYPPTDAKNKIYIIDEVHMLSIGAFNALLKTLEEPPEHVVFILATTDPQKIPATILSRCQRLDFHRIPSDTMVDTLKGYMEDEEVVIDIKALKYIARICDGAMRDALSLLDQCMAYYFGEELDIEKVLKVTGSVDSAVFINLIEALNGFESAKAIEIIADAIDSGKDIHQLVSDLIVSLRNLLVSVSTNSNLMDMTDEAFEELKNIANGIKKENLIYYINEFSNLQGQMKYSSNPRILFETSCIKITNPESNPDNINISLMAEKLEKMISSGNISSIETISAEVKTEKKTLKPVKKPVPEDFEKVIATWDEFVKEIENKNATIFSFMNKKTYAGFIEGDTLDIVAGGEMSQHLLKREEEIKKFLLEKYQLSFNINIVDEKEYDRRHSDKYGAEDPNKSKIKIKEINDKLNGFASIE